MAQRPTSGDPRWQTVVMRDWFVGGAVIESSVLAGARLGVGSDPAASDGATEDGGVLLVENVRHDGRSDWTPPGGVIDAGEVLVDGLTREVREETGLDVVQWVGPLYRIVAEAPGLGWRLSVEVHRAVEVRGTVTVGDDPDGIVVAADWVGAGACADRLCDAHRWVREPLLEWMVERFDSPREFRYEVLGDRPAELLVERR